LTAECIYTYRHKYTYDSTDVCIFKLSCSSFPHPHLELMIIAAMWSAWQASQM